MRYSVLRKATLNLLLTTSLILIPRDIQHSTEINMVKAYSDYGYDQTADSDCTANDVIVIILVRKKMLAKVIAGKWERTREKREKEERKF